MKVALVNLTRGGLSGGYQKYIRELVPILQEHPLVKELFLFAPPGIVSQIRELRPSSHCVPCADTLRGRRQLKRALAALSPDVVFFPSYLGLRLGRTPTVYMIRNMEALATPLNVSGPKEIMRNLARYGVARLACRQGARILAVSQFVKDFLVRNWRIPAEKIGVVYHGVHLPPAPETLAAPPGIPPEWAGRFLFTAGSLRPARGLADAIRALGLLAAQGLHLPLVIAGDADRANIGYRRKMQELAAALGLSDQIIWAGHLSPELMSWCYYQAGAFLMTSRVEACPNVALEAMSHGCLSIAADNPPLPEFFREGALYYRPGDAASLAAAVREAMADPAENRAKLGKLARARALDFSWEQTAANTVNELAKVIRRKNEKI